MTLVRALRPTGRTARLRDVGTIAALVVIASIARADPGAVESLPVTQLRLRNDLHVILAPDPAASSVVVHVRYASGAAVDGGSGTTKLVEKLLGAGTVHVKDFDARVDAAGGWATTVTTMDYLGMTEQVPAHALELVLWLEAERMAGLPDGFTPETVARARAAVQDEFRAAYLEQPYGLVAREVQRRLWTDELAHYAQPILGTGPDAPGVALADVRDFARERVTPNNAIVVIAGRFEVAPTRRLVERYFGWIPARETVSGRESITVKPRTRAVEATVKDPLHKVVVAFRCEPFAPAVAIAAQVLAGGRTSRLSRALVDNGLAIDVHTEIVRQRASELRIVATPADGVTPARVASAIRDELAKLRAQPLTADELARAKAILETDFLLAMENVAVRADMLASWAAYAADGPLLAAWPARLHRPSGNELQRAFAYWLADTAAVTVIGQPEGP